MQSFDAWGKRLSGTVRQTDRSYTGQYLDDTGLLFYNARYYDPQVGRFISADSIVPGNASGGMAGVAYKPLTVDFHETGFVSAVNRENQFGPWYTLSEKEQRQVGNTFGPANPQALNRYSYVLNNPLKWTDPGGHAVSMSYEEALYFRELLFPLMNELAEIAQSGASTVELASVLASGLTAILGTIASNIDEFGAALADSLSGFLGGLASSLSDPTNAWDVYNLLKFMMFHIEGFLLWVANPDSHGSRVNERITFWATRNPDGRGTVSVHYNFVGPDGKIRTQPVSEKTIRHIFPILGSIPSPSARCSYGWAQC